MKAMMIEQIKNDIVKFIDNLPDPLRISDFIKKLEEIQKTEGDLLVCVHNEEYNSDIYLHEELLEVAEIIPDHPDINDPDSGRYEIKFPTQKCLMVRAN